MTTLNVYDATILQSPLSTEHVKAAAKGAVRQKARQLQKTKGDRSVLEWSRDLELIKTNKSEAAFARLFYHFAPRVKAFLIKSGADVGLAEECAQEVMVTVWRKSHLFDPTRASAATWIFTIARNKKIDALRKQLRPTPDDLGWGPEHEPDQEEMVGLQQESEKLGQAIAELPEKQRVLVERAYFKEMSHNEIAEATGLPLGTIKSRIRLALERLRHAMN